jgi:AraC-like DNA-binding protein
VSPAYPVPVQHTITVHQVGQMLLGVPQPQQRLHVLQRAGISPGLLESSLARVTQAQFARLMTALMRLHRDEFWGLSSRPLPLGTFANACRVMVTCRTLAAALRAGLRHYRPMLEDFVPRLQVESGMAVLRAQPRHAFDERHAYAARSFLFLSYGVMCWLAARRIPVAAVHYDNTHAAFRSEASQLFQAPIQPGVGQWGFEFDARWLELPVVQNAETVQDFLRQAPACLLVKYRDQASMTERIRRVLRRYLAEEMPSLDQISQLLDTTPQTLRRRLQREGQGYQLIKDALRRDVAVEYLTQSDLALPEIALRVGFSEVSTFHRAFKVWTGLTPGAYRLALQSGENHAEPQLGPRAEKARGDSAKRTV